MRIEEALRIASFARRPIDVQPDMRTGRPVVHKWLVLNRDGFFGGDPSGIRICYADMVPMMQVSYNEAMRYMSGTNDWEPYPGRYVIDIRRRFMRIDPRMPGNPFNF